MRISAGRKKIRLGDLLVAAGAITEEDLQEYIVYTRDGEGRTEGYTTYAADGTITRTCTYDYEADGHSYYAELFNGDGNKTGGSHYRYRPISEVTEG